MPLRSFLSLNTNSWTKTTAVWAARAACAASALLLLKVGLSQNTERPWTVQMHVHGSMSEGPGSMRGANVQAKKLGYDVLWWSDHDWRIAYHMYPAGYDFESPDMIATIPVPYKPGTDLSKTNKNLKYQVSLLPSIGNGKVTDTVAHISNERAAKGTYSLELAARQADAGKAPVPARAKQALRAEEEEEGGPRRPPAALAGPYQPFFYTMTATRQTMKRSLASDVELDVSVYTDDSTGPDGMAAIRVDLSQQPPDMESNSIFYVISAQPEAELKKLESARAKIVRLKPQPGKWGHYTLPLTADAKRLNLGGDDNSMVYLSFGVLTRGPLVKAFFDDLEIRHKYESEELRGEARRMAAALQKEYGVINYVGQEFSYQAHMNPLGDRVPMIDYRKYPAGLTPAETADFVHQNGGVVSLNHIFGTSRPPKTVDVDDPSSVRKFEDQRIQDLSESNVYGADMLEVGYPRRVLPMTSFLRVWDALSERGVYIIGNGVSDTHTSNGGWFSGNNFVSWVWAQTPSMLDVTDAFRRGAIYFGDPVKFKGSLRLSTEDGHQMGQTVTAGKASHAVTIDIQGLPPGTRVRTLVGGQYGKEFTAGGTLRETIKVDTSKRTSFRVEAYTAEGLPLLFSNPIWFAGAGDKVAVNPARLVSCQP